jgi:hypothetical protein
MASPIPDSVDRRSSRSRAGFRAPRSRSVFPLTLTDEGLWLAGAERTTFIEQGLHTLGGWLSEAPGKLLRRVPGRENRRLTVDRRDGLPLVAYVKRHQIFAPGTWLMSLVEGSLSASAGPHEAHMALRLERAGIGTIEPLACGARRGAWWRIESFVATRELTGFEQLDHFLRRRFGPRGAGPRSLDDLARANLVQVVADVTRRFHALGYNHRDLYACHFFIREEAPAQFDVRLIDLQRVQHRRFFRERWLIKDLSQLAYSLPLDTIGATDRVAFLRAYLGVRRLRGVSRRWIRRIACKRRLLAWRRGTP